MSKWSFFPGILWSEQRWESQLAREVSYALSDVTSVCGYFSPSWVVRIGSQYEIKYFSKNIRVKWAERAVNPVWMPQALKLKPLCLIQFQGWENSLFPLLALWGNKNWPTSMKVKKLKIFWNKMGSMDCKWSSLNAPGTQTPLPHPILKLGEVPFPIVSPLG